MSAKLSQPVFFGGAAFPAEVIDALEDDALVLFCGAGVSMGAGLPSFRGLVEDVYTACHTAMTPAEKEAFERGLFDRTFGLLENRLQEGRDIRNDAMRKAVIDRLDREPSSDLKVHEAILRIAARADDGQNQVRYRLVTTNFDTFFEQAPGLAPAQVHCAPLLPVPKPHKWAQPVYLHGRIDRQHDPHGLNLVVTSADFGAAYLTERWASRFATELFREFRAVLFVGYSVDDPIMRYLVDAIAAERRAYLRGGPAAKLGTAYALDGCAEEDRDKVTHQWRSKGIEPIFFSKAGADDYSQLLVVLDEFARWYTRQHKDKKALLTTYAARSAVAGLSEDVSDSQIVRLLARDADLARFFAGLDPLPPFAWYAVFRSANLLKSLSTPHGVPDEVELSLFWWLARQAQDEIGSQKLVEEIAKGELVNEHFREAVKDMLTRDWPSKPDDSKVAIDPKIKRILTVFAYWTGMAESPEERVWSRERACLFATPGAVVAYLLERTAPWVVLRPRFRLPNAGKRPALADQRLADLADFTFGIRLQRHDYDELRQLPIVRQALPDLAFGLTCHLQKCLAVCELLESYDLTIHRCAIAEHDQDKHSDRWMLLISLLRDSFEAAAPDQQRIIVDHWSSLDGTIFRRLIAHAYTVSPAFPVQQKVEFLLSLGQDGFWKGSLWYERDKLLESLAHSVTKRQRDQLLHEVLKGPPAWKYNDWEKRETTPQERAGHRDRRVFGLLELLKRYGFAFNGTAQKRLAQLKRKHPDWTIPDGDRAAMSGWSETRWGSDSDMSVSALRELSVDDLQRVLSEPGPQREGRLETWERGVEDNPDWGVQLLTQFADGGYWNAGAWDTAFQAFFRRENMTPAVAPKIVAVASRLPVELRTNCLRYLCFALQRAYRHLDLTDEGPFWQLWDDLMPLALAAEPAKAIPSEGLFTNAINHPAGILTESLVAYPGKHGLKAGQCLPDAIKARLDLVLAGGLPSSAYAKVIVYSGTHLFCVRDPSWAHAKLLPALAETGEDARVAWHGFLVRPYAMPSTFVALCGGLCRMLTDASHWGFSEHEIDVCYHLFGSGLLHAPNVLDEGRCQEVFANVKPSGLVSILRAFENEAGQNDGLWRAAIQRVFDGYWPRENQLKGPEVSNGVALLLIALGDELPAALPALQQYLTDVSPVHHLLFGILHRLGEAEVLQKHPDSVLDMLARITPDRCPWWEVHDLPKILTAAEGAGANTTLPGYIRLRDLADRVPRV